MAYGRIAAVILSCLAASGCASGPKLSEVQGSIPRPAEGQARVYFYRIAVLGAAVQPVIRVNDHTVGACTPQGVFYKDLAPGSYEATVATEVERRLTFTLDANEEKYVRCYISMGFFIGHGNLELVDPAEARGEMKDLSFIKE